MLRPLLVSCLCVSSCISRSIDGTNSTSLVNSNLGGSGNWWDTLASLDFNDFRTYVPTNVKKFVYDTYEDGKEIAYDLYEDIQEEVVAKARSNVDDFGKFIENLVAEVESIRAEEHKIWLQEEPLSEEQFEKRNKEVAETKKKLRDLADKIKEERSKDGENKEPLERAIQQFITYVRSIISIQFHNTEYIWSQARQVEGIKYKELEILAKSTNELKNLINDLFEKLSTVNISILGNRKKERNQGLETPRNIPN